MSRNNQIDLIEFPASSPEEVRAINEFFNKVFGWKFKEWDATYHDTQDSGLTAGINGNNTKEQIAPLTVIYSENLEATKQAIIKAGGKISHDVTAFPGGKRFAFIDPAGNQLAVWSDT